MKKFYHAGIVPENAGEGGGYSVYIPDVPQAAAGGESVAEAIDNAASALDLALRGMMEQNIDLPEPSALKDVQAMVRAEREQDGLPYPKETVYRNISALDTRLSGQGGSPRNEGRLIQPISPALPATTR